MIILYFMGTSEQEEELITYEEFSKVNLKIGSIISNGMLLAADGPEGRPVFLTITEDVSNGSLIH